MTYISLTNMRVMKNIGSFNFLFFLPSLSIPSHSFETLQRTTSIKIQPLILPLTLDISSANEQIIHENLPTFEDNGFKLTYDEDQPIGRRLQLWTKPYYKDVEFNVNDINELASLISEGLQEDMMENRLSKDYLLIKNQQQSNMSGSLEEGRERKKRKTSVMLPKLMSTFASKACRTAVMIGTGLEGKKMETIVRQLAEIDQPWNCPHGRPTLRHLVDLREIQSLL